MLSQVRGQQPAKQNNASTSSKKTLTGFDKLDKIAVEVTILREFLRAQHIYERTDCKAAIPLTTIQIAEAMRRYSKTKKPLQAKASLRLGINGFKLGITQPSLCLFHDSVEVGSPILDALNELRNETWPAHRKITFITCSRERGLLNL